jgi:hypothetical protein
VGCAQESAATGFSVRALISADSGFRPGGMSLWLISAEDIHCTVIQEYEGYPWLQALLLSLLAAQVARFARNWKAGSFQRRLAAVQAGHGMPIHDTCFDGESRASVLSMSTRPARLTVLLPVLRCQTPRAP